MFTIEIGMDPPSGTAICVKALENAPLEIKEAASRDMSEFAAQIAGNAAASVSQHPSGMYRNTSGSARYKITKKSLLSIGIATPSGAFGKALAMSEFARYTWKRTGATMIDVLNEHYDRQGGPGGGRILWASYDERESEYVAGMQEIVDFYAEKLEREAG